MASSKTAAKTSKPTQKKTPPTQLAVAFSGGLDSTVLLHATIKAHGKKNVHAFHVHHGIQKEADQWQAHCKAVAKKFGCHFDTKNVKLNKQSNIESQARNLRYEALTQMCEAHKIQDLLLAHHLDDQAETVLIQLMRGAGLPGLSAMPQVKSNELIHLWRPFLNMCRKDLESYAEEHKLTWIEDPSNQDESYRRNAVRKSILPTLEKFQKGAIENLARSAKHLGEAQGLLNQLADIDLGLIETKEGLSKTNLIRLYKTSQARATNALRRWLSKNGLAYPSEERLTAWWSELTQARLDAKLQWDHDQRVIRLWRGHLSITQDLNAQAKSKGKEKEKVTNEGEWTFKKVPANSKKPGIAKDRFEKAKQKGLINTMAREGGEKFKVDSKRPRKSLKNLYQEAAIPPWQRDVPLLYIGEELVAVAGIGISADWQTTDGPRFTLEWQAA
ncbi:tRNA lysidine(34) synthetase TilS [Polynucleobacter cosmopolitanus]|jgi:tRNA(Ile)-lysidine synthase|uniref:tRNA(Ile)-lysidine synthase n=1 Tax=Polynucleobacter cosmopolitanus TaxID=351345 RepID=A0A229FSW2_9BURK|nr:tRNA lysidine(34) synthetase TilS [Polynucleobacter cosmopolitanus]OXL14973.1 tRNA lysidine(34) synthetase TilS [Polynucleobacter cosmopolitanus]